MRPSFERLTYPVDIGDAVVRTQVPIVIGVLGEAGELPGSDDRAFRDRSFTWLTPAPEERGSPPVADPPSGVPRRWASLVSAASRCETDVRVRGLHLSPEELAVDARERPDGSTLHRKVYEEIYGIFGEMPLALLVVDFAFSNSPLDLLTLRHLAAVGSHAGCLVLAQASPDWIGVEGWERLRDPGALERFDRRMCSKPFADWQAFRDGEHARSLGLTVPGSAPEFAHRLVEAVGEAGMWARVAERNPREGSPRSPADSSVEATVAGHGFVVTSAPLAAAATCQRPRLYHDDALRNAVARAKPNVLRQLTASQFLHGASLLLRDSVGAYRSHAEWEVRLQGWVDGYVGAAPSYDGAPPGTGAPLRSAVMALREILGEPGSVNVVLEMAMQEEQGEATPATRHSMRTDALRFF